MKLNPLWTMKPQSCRNCGKELMQNQRMCPSCGRDTGYDDSNKR